MIGQTRRLGEKIFKRGFFALLVLRLSAIAGVQILLKVRSEVDLFEGILGGNGRFFFRAMLLPLRSCFTFLAIIVLLTFLAARNLPGVEVLAVGSVNPVSLAAHDKVLATVGAVKLIEERLQ